MLRTISDSLNSYHPPGSSPVPPSWDIEKISNITIVFIVTLSLVDATLRVGSLLAKATIFLNPTIGLLVLATCLVAAAVAIYQNKKSSECSEEGLARKTFSELRNIYTIKELTENIFNQEEGNLSLSALQEKFRQGLFVAEKLGSVLILFKYDLEELEEYNICPAEFIRECKGLKTKFDMIGTNAKNEQNTLKMTFSANDDLEKSLASTRDSLSALRSTGGPDDISPQAAALPLVITMGAQMKYSTPSQNVVPKIHAKKHYDQITDLSIWYESELEKIQKDYEAAYLRHFPEKS